MKKTTAFSLVTNAILFTASVVLPLSTSAAIVMTNQGSDWTDATRQLYYRQDQGSRIMPLKWMQALKQDNGKPFMARSLSRYGYLPNANSKVPNVPVGFTVAAEKNGEQSIGMTCSACHTRQIDVSGTSYRIDGGPALSDMQGFMADLDHAVDTILNNTTAFTEFATRVLGYTPTQPEEDALRTEVSDWFLPYHTLVEKALPTQSPWGVGRLDAVSMIFNRLTGLDIGQAPSYLIPENIKVADVPVRYPFLWNASIQDYTQWPGFSPNGNRLLGLARNIGEVYGVFAEFHPKKSSTGLLNMNYVAENSANFAGLNGQEELIMKLSAPKWPFALNKKLAAVGAKVFNKPDPNADNKSCADCHGITDGEFRSFTEKTWSTPIVDVGTDSREIGLLGYEVKTGVMKGATIFPTDEPLKAVDKAISVLARASEGAIIQHYFPLVLTTSPLGGIDLLAQLTSDFGTAVSTAEQDLGGFGTLEDLLGFADGAKASADNADATTPLYAYESRVLEGVWAVAPYLHNGSVPTLAELLKPAKNRVAAFKVGPAYDINNVGLATEQTNATYTLTTTDCSDRNSGNSRCGHEYGTSFSKKEKTALLEYLKSL